MFISFAAFQTLIRWLIYCLAGFNQLAPNIDAFRLFISVSLSSVCLHGFLSLFPLLFSVWGYVGRLIWQCPQAGLALIRRGRWKYDGDYLFGRSELEDNSKPLWWVFINIRLLLVTASTLHTPYVTCACTLSPNGSLARAMSTSLLIYIIVISQNLLKRKRRSWLYSPQSLQLMFYRPSAQHFLVIVKLAPQCW